MNTINNRRRAQMFSQREISFIYEVTCQRFSEYVATTSTSDDKFDMAPRQRLMEDIATRLTYEFGIPRTRMQVYNRVREDIALIKKQIEAEKNGLEMPRVHRLHVGGHGIFKLKAVVRKHMESTRDNSCDDALVWNAGEDERSRALSEDFYNEHHPVDSIFLENQLRNVKSEDGPVANIELFQESPSTAANTDNTEDAPAKKARLETDVTLERLNATDAAQQTFEAAEAEVPHQLFQDEEFLRSIRSHQNTEASASRAKASASHAVSEVLPGTFVKDHPEVIKARLKTLAMEREYWQARRDVEDERKRSMLRERERDEEAHSLKILILNRQLDDTRTRIDLKF